MAARDSSSSASAAFTQEAGVRKEPFDRRSLLRAAAGATILATGAPFLRRSSARAANTVTMWSQGYGDPKTWQGFIDEATSAFRDHSGIDVKWEIIPWSSALQKWDLVMSNGEVPDVADVFYLQSRVVQGQGKWGPLDLTDEVAAGTFGDFNRFVSVGQAETKYKDRIYGVPWRIDIRAFVSNTDLWVEAPADLAAFEAKGKDALAKGARVAASTYGVPTHAISQLGATWDVSVLSEDFAASNLADPRWQEALTWVQRMIDEKLLVSDAVGSTNFVPSDGLLNGTIGALFGGNPSIRPGAQGSAPQMVGKLRSSLMPAGPSGKQQSIASTAQLVVFENTESREASVAWLKYLTSSETAAKMAAASGQQSPDSVVQAANADPFLAAFFEQSKQAVSIDAPIPAWTELSAPPEGPLSQLAIDVWTGGDVAKALATAHARVNKVLANYQG